MTDVRCGTCAHWAKYHGAKDVKSASGRTTGGPFYGCLDPQCLQPSAGRSEEMGDTCPRWLKRQAIIPIGRVRLIQLEDDATEQVSERRKLLDLGFIGYLECVRQFHEQLDVEARARREAVERVDAEVRMRTADIENELTTLRSKFEDQLAEEVFNERVDMVSTMVEAFVAEVKRVKRFASGAAAVSVASSYCKALASFMTWEHGLAHEAASRPGIALRVLWLCGTACYLPRPDEPLHAFTDKGYDEALEHSRMLEIFDKLTDYDPILDDIPDAVLQRVANMDDPN